MPFDLRPLMSCTSPLTTLVKPVTSDVSSSPVMVPLPNTENGPFPVVVTSAFVEKMDTSMKAHPVKWIEQNLDDCTF